MTQRADPEDARGRAGFTLHSPHHTPPSVLQRCMAVLVLLAGTAAFFGMVVWPLVNILR